MLSALRSWLGRPARTRTAPRPTRPRLCLDALEDRSLLSGIAPTVLIDGPATVGEASAYRLNLTAVDPENDSVEGWTIDWGDGSEPQWFPGNPSSVTHDYGAGPVALGITASAVVGGESFAAQWSTLGTPLGEFVVSGGGGMLSTNQLAFGRDYNGDQIPDLYTSGTAASVSEYRLSVFDGRTGAALGTLLTRDSSTGHEFLYGLTADPDGNLFLVDLGGRQVLRYDVDARTAAPFIPAGRGGYEPGGDLEFGPDANGDGRKDLYAISTVSEFEYQIRRFDGLTGGYIDTLPGVVKNWEELKFGPDGDIYMPDQYGNQILRYDGTTAAAKGAFIPAATGPLGLSHPNSLAFGPDGDLYVVDTGNGRVFQYEGTTGVVLRTMTGGLSQGWPSGVAFGPDGTLYVGDATNRQPGAIGPVVQFAGPLSTTGEAELPVTVLDVVEPKTYVSSPNATIPSDLRTYSWTINVGNSGALFGLNVSLGITHPNKSELGAWLVSPSGTRVALSQTAIAGTTVSLQQFNGEPVKGTWTLQLRDGVKANRGTLVSWSLEITRGVGPGGEPPVALNDSVTVKQGTTTPVVINVLANDSDPENGPLAITDFTQPETGKGTVTLNADGTFSYYLPPGSSFTGAVTFTYTITDPDGNSSTATVTINVVSSGGGKKK